VEKISGVPAEDLKKAARLYAGANKAAILYAMGITQHISGTDNVKSVANLAMLCGNVGIERRRRQSARGQNKVQGACDMGALPNVFPAYQAVGNEEIRGKFEKAWNAKLDGKWD
jgi:predicted molibdopterin-dependent oxidoreductase YjgC